MKKALSVLLVAAALFGFYGSAVTVNDLLACKDYWEEAGEKSTADMNKLEDGLNQLLENEQAYLDGQDQIADAEVQLAEGEAKLAKGEADYAAAPGKLAKGKADLAAGWAAYNDGKADLAAGQKEYNDGAKKLAALTKGINTLESNYNNWKDKYDNNVKSLIKGNEEAGIPPMKDAVGNDYSGYFDNGNNIDLSAVAGDVDAAQTAFMEYYVPVAASVGAIKEDGSNLQEVVGKTAGVYKKNAEDGFASAFEIAKNYTGAVTYNEGKPVSIDPDKVVGENYTGTDTGHDYEADKASVQDGWNAYLTNGPKAVAAGKTGSKFANLKLLAGVAQGKKDLQAGIKSLFEQLGEENMKEMGSAAELQQLQTLLFNSGDAGFEMGADALVQKAHKLLEEKNAELAAGAKKLEAGKKQLAAGLKKLRKGEADYAQGLKDYAAAPGQLEEGRQQLADGYKQYEDGKNQLAQYEDGEQQIRDGLATLFNTEADLELESIANRLNGDGDFDNGDNHLEIDEGLNAVEVGRGYQAEDGVLITNEIMGRAVATGGLLAAAVLAVLAAILSFLNKNKGAGVFAILAAVAGAFGAFYGPAQGTYFSEIAGSTIGATTWVAAGVLGAVALVHAIAHFAAKKAA